MESERFDQVTRVLGKELNRRRAIGVLGVLLGSALASLPLQQEIWAKPGKKDKGKSQGKRQGHHKGNDRNRNGKKHHAANQAEPCWRAGACIPKKGSNVSRCNLAGYTAPPSLNCTGCNISRANLRGANLSGANLTKANLSGACLVDANLSGAVIANNTNMANAVMCRTTMPDGSLSNAGCGLGTECCPVCDATHPCPTGQLCCSGRCVTGTCCTNAECANPILPICVNNTCSPCTSSDQCGAGKACADGSCVPCLSPDPSNPAAFQAAITNTPAGGTLRLCPGTFRSNAAISKNLTLIGAGADSTSLGGNQSGAVLTVTSGAKVEVRNLTVSNGRNAEGGCIRNSGTLTIAECKVTGGVAAFGGGIFNDAGASLLVDASVVSGNRADNSFGLSYQGQGGGVLNNGDAVFKNGASIDHNTATYIAGGFKNGKTVTFDGCSISANTTSGRAGGLWNTDASWGPVSATLNNCSVDDNVAAGQGGGILNSANASEPITFVTGGEIKRNHASSGGGIFNYSAPSTVVITGVDISNNTPNNCYNVNGCF